MCEVPGHVAPKLGRYIRLVTRNNVYRSSIEVPYLSRIKMSPSEGFSNDGRDATRTALGDTMIGNLVKTRVRRCWASQNARCGDLPIGMDFKGLRIWSPASIHCADINSSRPVSACICCHGMNDWLGAVVDRCLNSAGIERFFDFSCVIVGQIDAISIERSASARCHHSGSDALPWGMTARTLQGSQRPQTASLQLPNRLQRSSADSPFFNGGYRHQRPFSFLDPFFARSSI
jgi:hypothetical protein